VADHDPSSLAPIVQAAWAPIERRLLAGDPRLASASLNRLTAEVMERCDELLRRLTGVQLKNDDAFAVTSSGVPEPWPGER
jgi:hypothetical protein